VGIGSYGSRGPWIFDTGVLEDHCGRGVALILGEDIKEWTQLNNGSNELVQTYAVWLLLVKPEITAIFSIMCAPLS
jgi:hypothetical protein